MARHLMAMEDQPFLQMEWYLLTQTFFSTLRTRGRWQTTYILGKNFWLQRGIPSGGNFSKIQVSRSLSRLTWNVSEVPSVNASGIGMNRIVLLVNKTMLLILRFRKSLWSPWKLGLGNINCNSTPPPLFFFALEDCNCLLEVCLEQ